MIAGTAFQYSAPSNRQLDTLHPVLVEQEEPLIVT